MYHSPFDENSHANPRVSELQIAQNRRPSFFISQHISLQFDWFNQRFVASSHKAFGTRLELHGCETRRGNARWHAGAHYAGRDANTSYTAGRHAVSSRFLLYVYHCKSANHVHKILRNHPPEISLITNSPVGISTKEFPGKICILRYLK